MCLFYQLRCFFFYVIELKTFFSCLVALQFSFSGFLLPILCIVACLVFFLLNIKSYSEGLACCIYGSKKNPKNIEHKQGKYENTY